MQVDDGFIGYDTKDVFESGNQCLAYLLDSTTPNIAPHSKSKRHRGDNPQNPREL
jgi:hypothetical protein